MIKCQLKASQMARPVQRLNRGSLHLPPHSGVSVHICRALSYGLGTGLGLTCVEV